MAATDIQYCLDLVLRYVEQFGEFLLRWRTLQLLLQLANLFLQLVEGSQLVARQAHNAAVLGDGLQDALTNPPHGIADELEATCLVEALGGLDQSHIAFVDEVGQT